MFEDLDLKIADAKDERSASIVLSKGCAPTLTCYTRCW
jgi:hypothetical protein